MVRMRQNCILLAQKGRRQRQICKFNAGHRRHSCWVMRRWFDRGLVGLQRRAPGTIVQSPVPLVSGVGHETDFTIADFWCRPARAHATAAAELVSEPRAVWLGALDLLADRLQTPCSARSTCATSGWISAGAAPGSAFRPGGASSCAWPAWLQRMRHGMLLTRSGLRKQSSAAGPFAYQITVTQPGCSVRTA